MYSLVNQLENLVRNTKAKIRVFFLGNTLEEASDVLCSFNFIPEEYGRYSLVKNKKKLLAFLNELNACNNDLEKKAVYDKYKNIDFGKRAVIEYMEPTEAYLTRRKGTVADIIGGNLKVYKGAIFENIIADAFNKMHKDLYYYHKQT